MEEIVVYVHGKGGSAQEAEHYKALFPNCEVIGFDYHAQSPWEATEEFSGFFTAVRKRCGKLTLVANSIGAFFSFASLNEKLVDASYFISPVVDMEQLICNMMRWAGVSEAELATVYKGNIIKNLIMDCQSYTKYRPNETTGGIFVSWRRKEELPTGA